MNLVPTIPCAEYSGPAPTKWSPTESGCTKWNSIHWPRQEFAALQPLKWWQRDRPPSANTQSLLQSINAPAPGITGWQGRTHLSLNSPGGEAQDTPRNKTFLSWEGNWPGIFLLECGPVLDKYSKRSSNSGIHITQPNFSNSLCPGHANQVKDEEWMCHSALVSSP